MSRFTLSKCRILLTMLHRLKTQYISAALLLGSVAFLGITVRLVASSGSLVYFLTFHTPFHIQLAASPPTYRQPALPAFDVRAEIGQAKLSAAGILTMHVIATPKQTIPAYLEIWIRGPNNREMYKYPADVDMVRPVQFVSGRPQVFDEAYTLPANAPAGNYTVSASIVSVNLQVDYYNAHNFASFLVL